jgi:hypothetical protein
MPLADDIRYDRLCRTSASEAYLLSQQEQPVGRLELHFSTDVVYGLLVVEREMPVEDVLELKEKLDDDLVSSADSAREDFILTVYQGRQVGVYSDSDFEEEAGDGQSE